MNKKLLCLIIIVLTTIAKQSFAGPLCSLASPHYYRSGDQSPSFFALKQMNQVSNVLCSRFYCPQYNFFSNHSVGNAQAYMGRGGAQIRYSSQFMGSVLEKFGSQATIGIFAHELGHIIDFSTNNAPLTRAQREANADEYAGCAFALAGAPIQSISSLQNTLFAMGSSPGYPNTQQRAALIRSGYLKCSN